MSKLWNAGICNSIENQQQREVATGEATDDFFSATSSNNNNSSIPFHNFTNLEVAKADVERYILGFKNEINIPAFLFAMSVRGKTVMKKAWGTADLENSLPANVNNMFRIGSISKSFTSALVGRLVDQGQLHYEDQVSKYLDAAHFPPKSFSGHPVNITLSQLLSHTAGIPTEADGMFQRINPPENVTQMITRFRDSVHLYAAPGSGRFQYSNVGYQLLGAVIESVTGKSFQENLNHFLKHEAKLPSAVNWDASQVLHNVPRYYSGVSIQDNLRPGRGIVGAKPRGATFPSTPIDELIFLNGWWPAGGIVATLDDLLRWGHLPHAEVTGLPIFTQNSSYGYAFFVSRRNQVNQFVVFHSGGILGVSAQLTIFPDREIVGVTFSNKGAILQKEQMVLYAAANLYHLVK
ncbi:hypothetical protein TYRP_015365 [Tyrophagus putrescentiae]|nr:hypothetical protein TYRP_015365 [Tyrophagus putrescentiae]